MILPKLAVAVYDEALTVRANRTLLHHPLQQSLAESLGKEALVRRHIPSKSEIWSTYTPL